MPELPPPLPKSVQSEFHIEPLNERTHDIVGFIVIGLAALVWFYLFIEETLIKSGGMGPNNIYLLQAITQISAMFGSASLVGWMTMIVGLGISRIWLRMVMCYLACIPITVCISMMGGPIDGEFRLWLRLVIWVTISSSVFWPFRFFRWRVTHVKKLVVPMADGKGDELLIPVSYHQDAIPSFLNWYQHLKTTDTRFLDRLRPTQYSIVQIMFVMFVIAACITLVRIADGYIGIYSGRYIEMFIPLIIISFATLLVTWVILRSRRFAIYFFGWMILIFVATFVVIFFVTTKEIINLEADFYQTLQIGSAIEFGFSVGCAWFAFWRCFGYRLIRLPPEGFGTTHETK